LPSHENEEGNVPLVNALVVSSVWSDWSHGRRAWVCQRTLRPGSRRAPAAVVHLSSKQSCLL